VGKPIWGTELQIWDNEGRPLPPGRDNVGELVTRGFHVMKGYLNDPEATAEAFAGGWFHTGDLGYLDDDGFVFIVDRKKELIIRGGYNVYPREVEEVLYSHPAIAEAAVVGIPHHQLGEEIKAFVALKPGQELIASELIASELIASELIAYCKERVAAYKYPRVVEVRDELPKSATGKVLKKQLK
jgi:long-chain acyl-CoA synthetase